MPHRHPAIRPVLALALVLMPLLVVGAAALLPSAAQEATAQLSPPPTLAPAPASAPSQAPALAQVPADRQQIRLSFAPVVARTAPAVVNIYAHRHVRERINPFLADPFFRPFLDRPFGGPGLPFRERLQNNLGSGVIVRSDGLVVTNNHVIDGADEIRVVLADRREYAAEVVVREARTDLALLRLRAADGGRAAVADLPVVPLGDAERLAVGDLVLAIGNPFGVGQTVTSGIVSAQARPAADINDYTFFIQTDAAINPGNSGGALVDMDGRLVGIPTAIFSRTGGSIGIGFAIPVSMIRPLLDAAAGDGVVRRPFLGAGLEAVTADLADALGLDRPGGVLVTSVIDGGALAAAGLREGDVVLSVDAAPVDGPEGLRFRIAGRRLGEQVTIGYWRDGQQRQGRATLAVAPEDPPREPVTLRGRSPLAGATLVTLSPAVIEALDLAPLIQPAAVIEDVAPGSTAARFFQRGDVLLAVNGIPITGSRMAARLLEAGDRAWTVVFERDGQRMDSRFVY